MPVAHADVDRQRRVPRPRRRSRSPAAWRQRQLGDRRDAAERLVVMRRLRPDVAPATRRPRRTFARNGRTSRLSLRSHQRRSQHRVEGLGHVSRAIILRASSDLRAFLVTASVKRSLCRVPSGCSAGSASSPTWRQRDDLSAAAAVPDAGARRAALSLGVIEGVAEAANSVLKIAAGRLADRTGAPKRLVLAGYGLSSASSGRFIALVASLAAGARAAVRRSPRQGHPRRAARRDARALRTAAHCAAASSASTARWITPAPSSARSSASAFLFFYPDAYRTLFALSDHPRHRRHADPAARARGTRHEPAVTPDSSTRLAHW